MHARTVKSPERKYFSRVREALDDEEALGHYKSYLQMDATRTMRDEHGDVIGPKITRVLDKPFLLSKARARRKNI